MKTERELKEELLKIDRKPYPAYKGLKGEYQFQNYILGIDHVQGDPFASPSGLHLFLGGRETQIPSSFCDKKGKRTALADYMLRAFHKAVKKYSFAAKGSGKSGLFEVSSCGQQVLERTACEIGKDGSLLLRFHAGFPANGRTINSRELKKMLLEFLPKIVTDTLIFKEKEEKRIRDWIDLYEDQEFLYEECEKKGWVSFVADGSILPRKSGVLEKPMEGAEVFFSPDSLREEVILPHRGKITGMAVPKGITLIVGGGYHGKSTLLYGIETGIYHHIKGDGREYICTCQNGVKIRAEDGRAISGTDISMFIHNLPNKKDTKNFWTEDASGSTSQAANVAEAVMSGSTLLLIDEDTSATNFMVRDELMAKVIAREKEPITPFLERARTLYEHYGISTVMVAGSSGAYFSIADRILQMDSYKAFDITKKVRSLCPLKRAEEIPFFWNEKKERRARVPFLERKKGRLKVKQYSTDSFSIGEETLELRGLEQILDYEQTTTLMYLLKHLLEQMEGKEGAVEEYLDKTWDLYEEKGMPGILKSRCFQEDFARVRKQDFYAAAYRFRGLRDLPECH